MSAPLSTFSGGAYDFATHNPPAGSTLKNWARDNITNDTTPNYREITSWVPRASVGTVMCKFGKRTGYTCGTVENNNYSYQGSASWLLTKSTSTTVRISCPGDSGAPVYNGGIAYGMHTAGWCDVNNNKTVTMPSQGFYDKGFTPLTVP